MHEGCLYWHSLTEGGNGLLDVSETLAYWGGTTLWQRYVLSFWWTFAMLIGSELIIMPTTDGEVVFTMALQMIGVGKCCYFLVLWAFFPAQSPMCRQG